MLKSKIVKSKDYFLSEDDIDSITDVIEYLSNILKYGLNKGQNHNLWASYYRLASSSFNRMRSSFESHVDIVED